MILDNFSFLEFPNSHEEGFVTIVELEESVACQLAINRSMILELLKTMQYSQSNQGGGGIKSKKYVKFLATSSFDDLITKGHQLERSL
jgi:hypothetical protein